MCNERKNKCFEYGNGLHNSEGSDVKSDCVSGKRVGLILSKFYL